MNIKKTKKMSYDNAMSGYRPARGGAPYGGSAYGGAPYGQYGQRADPYSRPAQPFPPQRNDKLGFCAIHQKHRAWFCLVDDGSGNGTFICTPEQECKAGGREGSGNEIMTCSEHGKRRSKQCLVDDGAGGFRCTSDSICKISAGGNPGIGAQRYDQSNGGPYHDYNAPNSNAMMHMPPSKPAPVGDQMECSLHGEMRSRFCLMNDAAGNLTCMKETPCKGAGADSQAAAAMGLPGDVSAYMQYPQMDDPTAFMAAQQAQFAAAMYQQPVLPGVDPMSAYMMAPQVMFEPPQNSSQIRCSKHGKMRSRACMEDDGRGGLCCSADYECKTKADPNQPPAGGTMMCSMHGKNRSMNCLIDDGMGGYRCSNDNQCKGGGNPGDAAGGTMLCSIHGKNRSMNCLTDDGMGGLRCVGDNQCKGGNMGHHHGSHMTEMAAAIHAYQAQNQASAYGII